jgi:hypothetical protein
LSATDDYAVFDDDGAYWDFAGLGAGTCFIQGQG